MATQLRSVDQLALDEIMVDDPDLEAALEHRLQRKVVLDKVRKEYDEAHEAAATAIAGQELPEGGALRCGRFRVTRNAVSARHVDFDAKATSRARITVLDNESA